MRILGVAACHLPGQCCKWAARREGGERENAKQTLEGSEAQADTCANAC